MCDDAKSAAAKQQEMLRPLRQGQSEQHSGEQ
jgi:hypothetical protein